MIICTLSTENEEKLSYIHTKMETRRFKRVASISVTSKQPKLKISQKRGQIVDELKHKDPHNLFYHILSNRSTDEDY